MKKIYLISCQFRLWDHLNFVNIAQIRFQVELGARNLLIIMDRQQTFFNPESIKG